MNIIGQGLDRLDDRLKVTGGAKYSAEHPVPRLAQAVIVQSTIASGTVVSIDDSVARSLPGVLLVMTHANAPRLPVPKQESSGSSGSPPAAPTPLLQDACVKYDGQPVAVVVADTLEHAAPRRPKPEDLVRREAVGPRHAGRQKILENATAAPAGRKNRCHARQCHRRLQRGCDAHGCDVHHANTHP